MATLRNTHGRDRDDMRRDAKSLLNRLKSIQADAAFVSEMADLFPQFPILANERCGTWYVHPSKIHRPGVYFKSTDGHTGIWDFNLRRYNPHLINAIIDNGGCIIVDSTRKGKRVPDALSKTIPIWCATINNAVRKKALENQKAYKSATSSDQAVNVDRSDEEMSATLLVPALDDEHWDVRYHSLPSVISRSEHAQIAEKIEGFADKLMRFTDMTPLTTRLLKPIRPIWLTPQSFIMKDDPPDYNQVGFFPVICLSASRVVQDGMEEQDGYLYVQGSGDDEEMWSKGLTPDLFWNNIDYLLEDGITASECENRAKKVVQDSRRLQLETSKPSGVASSQDEKSTSTLRANLFTPSMERCSEIAPSPIWIGNNASGKIPACWDAGYDMVINCGAEIKRESLFELEGGQDWVTALAGVGHAGAQASLCEIKRSQWPISVDTKNCSTHQVEKSYFYLHLPIAEGKKGQHDLLAMIPVAIEAVRKLFLKLEEWRAQNNIEDKTSPRILVHCQQGMDRSVGISLALLVACFDEESGAFVDRCGSSDKKYSANKEFIQRRLFQIMSHRLAARPSRATLKIVNTFFMSPTDPPPAKYT
ncbi:tRNA A64-2'-O-ribosylphosphate transferase [Entomortierella parvispora]|uniref:tRNA A64-2'-O-ribosylphosphate transferase n=1 Tax=Entomortierella parvispora TaxID=205924 RepID=A0A9P3H6K8_9FUNG|nr:tRNA A64-2'-O-ribosylphosphate transferase [Entomortierella parvispora]